MLAWQRCLYNDGLGNVISCVNLNFAVCLLVACCYCPCQPHATPLSISTFELVRRSLLTVMIPFRVKRKLPPAMSVAERFPSPDPSDPFAPLWVIRSRISSEQDCQHSIELRQPTLVTQRLSPEYHLCEVGDEDSGGTESDTTVPHVRFKAIRRPFHGRRFPRFLAQKKTALDDSTTANKANYKHIRRAFISTPVVSVVLQESEEKCLVPMSDCSVYRTAGPIPESLNTYFACASGRLRHSQSFGIGRPKSSRKQLLSSL